MVVFVSGHLVYNWKYSKSWKTWPLESRNLKAYAQNSARLNFFLIAWLIIFGTPCIKLKNTLTCILRFRDLEYKTSKKFSKWMVLEIIFQMVSFFWGHLVWNFECIECLRKIWSLRLKLKSNNKIYTRNSVRLNFFLVVIRRFWDISYITENILSLRLEFADLKLKSWKKLPGFMKLLLILIAHFFRTPYIKLQIFSVSKSK